MRLTRNGRERKEPELGQHTHTHTVQLKMPYSMLCRETLARKAQTSFRQGSLASHTTALAASSAFVSAVRPQSPVGLRSSKRGRDSGTGDLGSRRAVEVAAPKRCASPRVSRSTATRGLLDVDETLLCGERHPALTKPSRSRSQSLLHAQHAVRVNTRAGTPMPFH